MAEKAETPGERLIEAAAQYVDSIGGKAVVGGPIQIEHEPGDDRRFVVRVVMFGRRPVKPEN